MKMISRLRFSVASLVLVWGTSMIYGPHTQAAMPSKVTVRGVIYSMDEKIVELKNKTGIVKVPRSAIKNENDLKPNAEISVQLSLNTLVYYNKPPKKNHGR